MKNQRYILTVVCLFNLIIGLAQTNYFVDDSSDVGDIYTAGTIGASYPGNDGLSASTPVNNVQDIIDNYVLGPGDTVFIDAGNYIDHHVLADGLIGASGTPIVFLGADSATTIFTNSSPSDVASFTLNSSSHTVWKNLRSVATGAGKGFFITNNSDYNEILNCRTVNTQYAIDLLSTHDVNTPNNNLIHDNYLEGVFVTLRIKADKARISANTSIGYSWTEVADFAPRYNEIYDNKIVNNAPSNGFATIELHATKENSIYRNVIVMNPGITADGIIFLAHGVSGNTITNNYLINLSAEGARNYGVYIDDTFDYSIDFQHNSIYTMDACFYARQAANGFTFNNNILYSVQASCMKMGVSDTKLGECINNYYYFPNGTLAAVGGTNISSVADWKAYNPDGSNNARDALGGNLSSEDPLFENPETWNLDLQCGSQAMDASFNPLLSVVDDIHKAPRPQGLRLDIGGFEGALVEAGTFENANVQICTGESAIMAVNNYVGSNPTWEESTDGINWVPLRSSIIQLADSSIYVDTINPGTSPIVMFFRMYVSGICNSDTTDIGELIIDPLPEVVGDIVGGEICVGESHDINLVTYLGDSITWQSSVDGNVWSSMDESSPTLSATPQGDMFYRAYVSYQSGVCRADTSNVVFVNVHPSPEAGTITGGDICPGEEFRIRILGYEGDSIFWEQSETGFNDWSLIDGESADSLLVTPSMDSDYRAFVKYGNGLCPIAMTNTATIKVGTNVTASFFANPQVTFCVGDSGTLSLEPGIGEISWEEASEGNNFGPFTGGATSTTSAVVNYTNSSLNNDTTWIRVKFETHCDVGYSDTAMVIVHPAPVAGTITGATICPGENKTITLQGQFGDSIYWEQSLSGFDDWTRIDTVGPTSISVAPMVSTDYRVVVQIKESLCKPDTTTTTIFIDSIPHVVNIDLVENSVCEEGGTVIEAYVSTSEGQGTNPLYKWSVNGVQVEGSDSLIELYDLKDGDEVCLDVMSSSTCAVPQLATSNCETIISERCECQVFIPSAFSPNSDNSYDYWVIDNIDCYENPSIEVYNRWGSLVFESKGRYEEWDGTSNGKILPFSTYFYIVKLDDDDELAGTVSIMK